MAYKPLSAGGYTTCAVTSPGLKCWGLNEWGNVGNGTTVNQLLAVGVSGLTEFYGEERVSAVVTGWNHNCALTTQDRGRGHIPNVYCWGDNSHYALGHPELNVNRYKPMPVRISNGNPNFFTHITKGRGLALGNQHTCVLMDTGAVKCWGDNSQGQLGVGTTTGSGGNFAYPVNTLVLTSRVREIAAGAYYTCARLEDGGVKCWGANENGQLGDGTTIRRLTPVAGGVSSDAVALATGSIHACVLLGSGGVKCWGANHYGQLGNGTTTSSGAAVNVSGLDSDAVALATGAIHACVLLGSGAVKCWGANDSGQLGDGTKTQRLTPVSVFGISSGAIAISAGASHACALLSTGGIKCWGFNQGGILD